MPDGLRAPDDVAEASWLREEAALPRDRLVRPGLTVGDVVDFHRRPATPPGVVFEPDVVIARPRRSSPVVMHRYQREAPESAAPAPMALFVHGGAWESGHPFMHIRRACLLAGAGWVTATTSYRRLPAARWPDPLDDVMTALDRLVSDAEVIGGDPGRIALIGDSSGGQLALLAAAASSRVRSVACWSPVTDLRRTPAVEGQVARLVGTDGAARAAASPASHVRDGLPPVLTFAGDADDVVPLETLVDYHRLLDAAGVTNRLVVRPGAGHSFDFDPDAWTETYDVAAQFLHDHVG